MLWLDNGHSILLSVLSTASIRCFLPIYKMFCNMDIKCLLYYIYEFMNLNSEYFLYAIYSFIFFCLNYDFFFNHSSSYRQYSVEYHCDTHYCSPGLPTYIPPGYSWTHSPAINHYHYRVIYWNISSSTQPCNLLSLLDSNLL